MMDNINLAFTVMAAALAAVVSFRLIMADGKDLRDKNSGLYLPILCLVVFAALFVRVYKFGSVPGGFNQDGAMAAVDAKALADYGTDRYGMRFPVHLTAWGYGQMSALLSYLMVPFIKLFGLSAVTARLPQLLVSLLGLLALYFFCRDAFGARAALTVLTFAAVNPWHIMQSRWALDCNLYPHFFMFGVYFLHRALKNKHRPLWLCLSMIMLGLCMYCYGISIYTMPFFLLLACVILLIKGRVTVGESLMCFGVWLLISWPFILTMAINFFKWDTIELPYMTLPYFKYSVRSNDILFFSDDLWQQLRTNLKCLWNIAVVQAPDLLWNSISDYGTMYLFSLPFLIVGIVYSVKNLRANDGALLLALMLLTGIWCCVCTNSVNVNRANIIFYPIIIFTGIGLYAVAESFKGPYVPAIAAAMYIAAFCLFSCEYFGDYADKIEVSFMKSFGQAVSAVDDEAVDKIYITGRSQSSNTTNVSEILTLFYRNIDAEYFQGNSEIEGFLPYKERYTYSDMEYVTIDPEEKAAYVISQYELQFFDLELYDIQQFGNYYVLTTR